MGLDGPFDPERMVLRLVSFVEFSGIRNMI